VTRSVVTFVLLAFTLLSAVHAADAPQTTPADEAVRGDRSEGWLAQSRSPVLARNGMVATSQPLAAQAGLRILMQGGNAVDAAVATAATLNVVEPMMEGIGGDVFAIIYIAKDRRYYVLNASGKAPSGATIAHYNALGYAYDPKNWGPGSGMPRGGILDVTVPGTVWGWDAVLGRFGTMKFDRVLAPAIDYAQNGYPVSERIAHDWRCKDAARGWIPIRCARGIRAARLRRPGRSFAIPTWRARCGCCSATVRPRSTMARSRGRSSLSRARSVAR
jgi:hypothetical protein